MPGSKLLACTQFTHEFFGKPGTLPTTLFQVFAAVASELEIAVVGPGPDQVLVFWRLADREDCGVHFRRGIVDCHAARLFLFLLLRVVRRQVGRDALPTLAVVAGAEKKLRADVDRPFLVRRSDQRRVPVEAQLFLVVRLRLNDARFERVAVDPADIAALVFGVDVIGIGRIDEGVKAIAVEDIFPLRVGDAAGIFRLADPAAVILQSAVDPIRIGVIHAHVIELRNGQVLGLSTSGCRHRRHTRSRRRRRRSRSVDWSDRSRRRARRHARR